MFGRKILTIFIIVGVLVCILLFILPIFIGLLAMILPSFGYFPALGGGQFHLSIWYEFWHFPHISQSIFLSFFSGMGAAILSFSIAAFLCAGISITQMNIGGGKAVRISKRIYGILSLCLSLPHVAFAVGFLFLIQPSGFIMRLLSPMVTGVDRPPISFIVPDPYGISLMGGLLLKEVPFLLLLLLMARRHINERKMMVVAMTMGYSPHAAWFKVILPLLYKHIRAGVFIVIAFSLSVVDVGLILGPSIPPTLGVRIFNWMNDADITKQFLAAAGGGVQLLLVVVGFACWRFLEILLARLQHLSINAGHRSLWGEYFFPHIQKLLKVTGAGVFVMTVVILTAFAFSRRWRFPDSWPDAISWKNWQNFSHDIIDATLNSIIFAVLAGGIAVLFVLALLEFNKKYAPLKFHKMVDYSFYLPLMIPQISFLLGVQIAFLYLDNMPIFVNILWMHLLFTIPYVYLSLKNSYKDFDDRYMVLAKSFGKTPFQAYIKVKLPLLKSGLMTAFAIAFAVSIAQYLPTILAGAGIYATVTTEAVTLSSGGNAHILAIYAFIQACLPCLIFLILFKKWNQHDRRLAIN